MKVSPQQTQLKVIQMIQVLGQYKRSAQVIYVGRHCKYRHPSQCRDKTNLLQAKITMGALCETKFKFSIQTDLDIQQMIVANLIKPFLVKI
jgi:hypothetical protein